MTKRMKEVKEVQNTKNSDSVVKVESIAAQTMNTANYDRSKKLVKKINSVKHRFHANRTVILSLVANNKECATESKNEVVTLLRKSKKDSVLFHKLCDIAEFKYKIVTIKDNNNATKTKYVKSYTVKNVTDACDLYLQINKDLDVSFTSAIKFECEKRAIESLKENIANLQNECNLLSNTIEDLESAEIITVYSDQLKQKERSLKKRVQMLDYVSVASNRTNITDK